MFSQRTRVLAVLVLVPLLVYLTLGAYALWQTGLFAETFWILPVCWFCTWLVSLAWKRESPALYESLPHPPHLTPRDEAGLKIVRRFQEQVDQLSPEQLTEPTFYLQQAQALAGDLARHYHPDAKDPVSELTVPEVLAAVRLAVDDMERWLLEAVPGSRLVTIRQWRWLRHAPKWVERIQNVSWAAGMLLNPLNALRYVTSKMTMGPVTAELQTEFLAAIYLRFIRQAGFYLVEMNSGRLRGGADHYRAVFGSETEEGSAPPASVRESLEPESLAVALVGQVKAGKSSLVNALIGERVAKSDVLPETKHVARYQLTLPDSDKALVLLDTPGYADAGATRQQLDEVKQALRGADVVLLVLDAHSPARDADRKVVDELRAWFAEQSKFRPPPLIACLTHIDLLSPMMEWKPPYNWRTPQSLKEHSIHNAVEHVRELFRDVAKDVIPLCTDVERSRAAHVAEDLLPALLGVLSDGQMAAMLRAYHKELDRGKYQLLLKQIQQAGRMVLNVWLEERLGGKR